MWFLALLVCANGFGKLRRLRGGARQAPNLHEQTPENVMNVLNYEIAMPTPEAAIFDGMYCRGGACQYRTGAPPPLVEPTPLVPAVYPRSSSEFCRGLTCLPGMGAPADTAAGGFMINCLRLYIDIGGGMVGQDGARTIADAKASFFKWCTLKFPPPLIGACNGLGEVVVMSLRGSVQSGDVGDASSVCYATYLFIGAARQAEIDLRLLRETLPKMPSLVQEYVSAHKGWLPSSLAQGGGDLGPMSPRGKAWRAFVLERRRHLVPPQQIPALLQTTLDPAFKPDYDQSPPCLLGAATPHATKIMLNYAIPPAEVDQDLYEFCAGTFAEIMMGFGQTGEMVITMIGDWCSWQSSVSDWVGRHDELGHPDWDFRRCQGMQDLVSYALRNDFASALGPKDVCTKVYLAMGDIEWMAGAVDDAWAGPALRNAPAVALSTASNTDAMKKLMKDAAAYADKVFSKLRKQKDMYEDLNGAKMDTSAFSLAHTHHKPRPPPLPPLPTFSELG
jgi:hypothetical protein